VILKSCMCWNILLCNNCNWNASVNCRRIISYQYEWDSLLWSTQKRCGAHPASCSMGPSPLHQVAGPWSGPLNSIYCLELHLQFLIFCHGILLKHRNNCIPYLWNTQWGTERHCLEPVGCQYRGGILALNGNNYNYLYLIRISLIMCRKMCQSSQILHQSLRL